jgi:hypothetical protein
MQEQEGRSSFLKKRSKKITLSLAALRKNERGGPLPQISFSSVRLDISQSFLFFFKKLLKL